MADDRRAKTPPSKQEGEKPKRGWGFAATLALVMAAIASVVVTQVYKNRRPDDDAPPLANREEMFRVVGAVSGIILAPEGQQEGPVRALEAIRPTDPASGDLRDACVTTYRGLLDLDRLVNEQRRLLRSTDGGVAAGDGGTTVPPAVLGRVVALNQQAEGIVQQVRDTKDRCLSLYEAGARRLGVTPARRPR